MWAELDARNEKPHPAKAEWATQFKEFVVNWIAGRSHPPTVKTHSKAEAGSTSPANLLRHCSYTAICRIINLPSSVWKGPTYRGTGERTSGQGGGYGDGNGTVGSAGT